MKNERSKTLAIIGQGYVGLPLAMAAVSAGWKVIGVDAIAEKVKQINIGSSPVEDISDAQLQGAIGAGTYKATMDYSEVANASVITICVPTPLNSAREPDLSLLESAAESLSPFVCSETLIVSESTSYPGTLREIIIPIVEKLKPNDTKKLYFASAPERVNPGDVIWNQKNTPRLVGGIDEESRLFAKQFYDSICDAAIQVSSPEIAEAAKLLENTFRLVNIGLINEFTQICATKGLDVNEIIDSALTKPYGFMPFRPGVGVGGHCIPVDPLYLTWWARRNGNVASLVEAADSINTEMPKYVAARAMAMLPTGTQNPKVLIFGVAYKPGISDTRESPVAELMKELRARGAEVAWNDPLVESWEKTRQVGSEWDCDVAILATSQPGMEFEKVLKRNVPLLDCTNTLRNYPGVIAL
jgi:UDP-N-acetyl-D-glucosamine dehydrogenase